MFSEALIVIGDFFCIEKHVTGALVFEASVRFEKSVMEVAFGVVPVRVVPVLVVFFRKMMSNVMARCESVNEEMKSACASKLAEFAVELGARFFMDVFAGKFVAIDCTI